MSDSTVKLAPCPKCGKIFTFEEGLYDVSDEENYFMCPFCEARTAACPAIDEAFSDWEDGIIKEEQE